MLEGPRSAPLSSKGLKHTGRGIADTSLTSKQFTATELQWVLPNNQATTTPCAGSNESQHQKGDFMSSKDRQGKNSQANPSADSGHAIEPSGPKGDNPATAGPGPTKVSSSTPENRLGHINPSAPEDSNTTPGTAGEK